MRLVPLLPYTFVNLCCGAFGVRFRVFVAGTILGMAPGIVGLAVLGERLLAVIRHPSPEAIAGLCAAVAVVAAFAVALRRRARRRMPPA